MDLRICDASNECLKHRYLSIIDLKLWIVNRLIIARSTELLPDAIG